MQILARFTNVCDFYDFWKVVANAFLRISKIPMVNVEIHSFFSFVQKFLSPSVTNLCPAKLNLVYKLKDFSAMLGGRKRNCYVIPVWSGKTVLEMLSVESTSLILPIYMALRSKPLTLKALGGGGGEGEICFLGHVTWSYLESRHCKKCKNLT